MDLAAARAWTDEYLAQSAQAMQALAGDDRLGGELVRMAARVAMSLRAGGKLLLAGNGGSAADAQHIAAEFLARLMYDRAPMAALALTTDSSVLTATANDYGYDHVFSRQVRGLGRAGDVLLAISTSGRSRNVLAALDAAREGGLATIAFCGADPGGMAGADFVFAAPSASTAIIQQLHITAAHALCGLVEREMFPPGAG